MNTTSPTLAPTAVAANVPTATAASTYNWDTAFAIPVPDVNAAIVSAGSTPNGFSFVPTGSSSAVKATFAPWQISTGGDGKNLRMSVPMPTLTVGDKSYTDVAATIEIKLEMLPHTDVPPPPTGVLKKLVARTTTADPTTDPVVVVGENITATPSMGILDKAVFQVGFSQWINQNLGEFNHIFAVININEAIDGNAQWAFTTPSYVEYAVLEKDTLEDSVFAVLCMTGGRSGAALTPQISPNVIPPGAAGGFLLSPTRYLADLLVPSLMHCYRGLQADQVALSSDSSSVALKPNVTVDLDVVEQDGKEYQPTLTALEISVLGTIMKIASSTQTEVSPGITAFTNATHWYHIKLDNRADGTQSLKFVEAQTAVIEHYTHKSAGIEIAEILLGIITVIGVVIAGVLTDGAAFVAAAVIIGALGGLAAAAPAIIALVDEGDAPSIDALLLNTTGPITWPGSKDFPLVSATLNESLQLGGTPHFS